MIALIRGDSHEARQLLMAAIEEDESPAYKSDQIMIITLAALASEQVGQAQEAERLLQDAQRNIRRGRLNGVDNANIYYSEAVLLVMNDQPESAVEKLQEAYDRGFREQWMMEVDGRLNPLRDEPRFMLLMDRIRDDVSRARAEVDSLPLALL
jgi:ATP/maltotriose-dependent transcriptional regulator MalT